MGDSVGCFDGDSDGDIEGDLDGPLVVGDTVGILDGWFDGSVVGVFGIAVTFRSSYKHILNGDGDEPL